jgi:hypothetical protein
MSRRQGNFEGNGHGGGRLILFQEFANSTFTYVCKF